MRSYLQDAYEQDTAWKRILDLIRPKQTEQGDEDPADKPPGLRFSYRNRLIYYTDDIDGRERLCIPSALEKEIFELAHDKQHHSGFHRTYDRITASLFIRHLTKRLKAYILHCPECQLNQTTRHTPYGSLHSISTPSIPFHTITMDFILALPPTKEGLDNLLTVTDKFTKRVLLLPGKTTYSAVDWANVLLPGLVGHDWGIPRQIISDRDRKFLSSFWRTIFERLGTKLLTSTAYHPQTDGQSERTNQTVEIALRYFLTSHPEEAFTTALPYLQGSLNNSRNASTGYAPNELAYGFRTNDTLDTLTKTDLTPEDYTRIRQIYREEAEDSIAFANATSKSYYDAKHTPLTIGSKAYLRLFHGYTIPGLTNRKLSNQRVGPFQILRRVGTLAYELKLPPTMKIHPVVSVAQLEPAPLAEDDPYNREQNAEPPPVENEATDDPAPAYEIERLLDRRVTRRGRGKPTTQYLVKWKGYNNSHNVWYEVEDLQDARELLDDYERRYPS